MGAMDAGSVLQQRTLRTLRTRSRLAWFLLGMVAVALMVTLTSCFGPSSTPLRIGANLWTGYEALFLARDMGDLKGKPIRLIDFTFRDRRSQGLPQQ